VLHIKYCFIFFIFIYSCSNSQIHHTPKDLPIGTHYSYSSKNNSEHFEQRVESFRQFHDIGTLQCHSPDATAEQHALCAQGQGTFGFSPSFTIFHTAPGAGIGYLRRSKRIKTVSINELDSWTKETATGKFIYGPFINLNRGGKLKAHFGLHAFVYALDTRNFNHIPSIKSLSFNQKDVLFTLQLVVDNTILSAESFSYEDLGCRNNAPIPEHQLIQIFSVNFSENMANANVSVLECRIGANLTLETSISGPVKNVEARILLENSPVNLSINYTSIEHQI